MKTISTIFFSSVLVVAAAQAQAGSINGLVTFNANTTAKASEVNGNFTAVKTAVDNNNTRIGTLETNPSISGNLALQGSSNASTGNIMKNGTRFLHDYGSLNVFLGGGAGNFFMTGTGANTGIGVNALAANVSGSDNTAVGMDALTHNTDGVNNVMIGSNAGYSITSGMNNVAIGYNSLSTFDSGTGNVALGYQALLNDTAGFNIAIGYQAGLNLTIGTNNIDIGNQGVADEAQTIRIGSAQVRAFIAGIYGTNTASATGNTVVIDNNGQLGTVLSSRRYKDDIHAMEDASAILNKLHPVTFDYKTDHDPKGRHLQYGLVAEDVAKVAPNLVSYDKNGKVNGVYYRFLAPMLLNQYQKQQQTIALQSALLKKQAWEIVELKKQSARVTALERQMARINTVLASRQTPERLASVDTGMH